MRKGLTFFLLLALAWRVCAQPQLIAHSQVNVTQLSRNEARLLITLRVGTWPDSTPLRVFVLPDNNPLHQEFARSILGVYAYQLRRASDRQLFSGTGQAPEVVDTETEMLERVGTTPGAIGYVSEIPADANVLRVEVR